MNNRRKITVFFVSLTVIAIIVSLAVLAFIAFGKIDVYRETSPHGNIEVLIRGDTGFFEFTPFGGYEYELVIRKSLFGSAMLKEQFSFNADGVPLKADCVNIEWHENFVEVYIDNKKHQVNSIKKFVCYF